MRNRLSLLSVVMLFIVACGGAASPTQAPGSTPGPVVTPGTAATAPGGNQPPAGTAMCQTLTAEDVSRIAGKPAFIVAEQSGQTNCSFNVGGADVIAADYVLDFRSETGDLTSPKAGYPGGQDVSGVGDSAYWSPDADALWFMRGGQTYALQFVLFGDDDGDALAIAQQLAQAALARL